MQYIILIGDEKLTLDAVKSIEHYDSISCYDVTEINGRFCVDYGNDHVFYDYNNSVISDYEDFDLKKIPFKNPHFIMMVYTSEQRMKNILCQKNFLKEIYVDNDYGLILPIEEFIRLGMPIHSGWL
jgi:hypothetical protein